VIKSDVHICDTCKVTIAKYQCCICKRDLCNRCNGGGSQSCISIMVMARHWEISLRSQIETDVFDVCWECIFKMTENQFVIPEEAMQIVKKAMDKWIDGFAEGKECHPET